MSGLVLLKHEIEPHVAELIKQALLLIEAKYGPASTRPLAYHNSLHTENIVTAANQLADETIAKDKIAPSDKPLLLIAAAYHDIEQDKRSGENERASAMVAMEHMQATGAFSEKDINTVKRIIMATQVHFDKNGIMSQSASEDYHEKLIADADLASLGKPTPNYWKNAMSLFKELYPNAMVGDKVYYDFVVSQTSFLTHHHFYTPEANRLFPYKQDNVAFTKQKIAELRQ